MRPLRYGSVCSGIEAATAAWHPLGWQAAFFSEIDRFPRAVLHHHYPSVPVHGDFTTIEADEYGSIDLLVGGTPCQSFSIAGLRQGLADDRGNLTFAYILLAKRKQPQWILWENVPGVLSDEGGRTFGAFLGGLAECGYGFAYRILDAQYFGVPQRRRRVFVVGYLGDWRPAAAVLFESDSLRRDITPRRKARKSVAGPLTSRLTSGGGGPGSGTDEAASGYLQAVSPLPLVTSTVSSKWAKGTGGPSGDECGNLIATIPIQEIGKRTGVSTDDIRAGIGIGEAGDAMFTLQAGAQHGVAFVQNSRDEVRLMGGDGDLAGSLCAKPGIKQQTFVASFKTGQSAESRSIGYEEEVAPALESGGGGNNKPAILQQMAVRRLSPKECERLQGFSDDYTLIRIKGKYVADSARYKAIGNSMAVPVMHWLGQRIDLVRQLIEEENSCRI